MSAFPLRTASHAAALAVLALCLQALGGGPAWWTARGVLDTNVLGGDYAPANQGQVKWIATKAFEEFQANYPGGAGSALSNMIAGFAEGDNYTPINIGQLKYIALPFYECLYTNTVLYPWADTSVTNDYAPANVGQVKNLFSFDLTLDTDEDGMPDWWENKYFGDTSLTATGDYDEDCFTNLEEFNADTDPTDKLSRPAGRPNEFTVLVRGGVQPGGPQYDFYVGRFEVSNYEFVEFLNDAQANPTNARGMNMYFHTSSNHAGNVAMPDPNSIYYNGHLFEIAQSCLSYNTNVAIGCRYTVAATNGHLPVVGVTWYGAVKYCNWLTIDDGLGEDRRCYSEGYTMTNWHPITVTYAEWTNGFSNMERRGWLLTRQGYRLLMDNSQNGADPYNEFYAAAAWNGTSEVLYGFGRDTIDGQDANYKDSGDSFDNGTTPGGYYDGSNRDGFQTRSNANAYGIFDLSGNVREWINDLWAATTSGYRTVRGGSFNQNTGAQQATTRTRVNLATRDSDLGFRVARIWPGTVPADPSDLTFSTITASSVALYWHDHASNETGYAVYSSTNGGLSWTCLGTLLADTTAWTNSRLEPETEYCYRVYATNFFGLSSNYVSGCVTTRVEVLPAGPTNLSFTSVGYDAVELLWDDAATNEWGYAIRESTNAGTSWTWKHETHPNTTNWIDSPIDPTKECCYRVYATNYLGLSTAYAEGCVIPTNLCAYALPAELSAEWWRAGYPGSSYPDYTNIVDVTDYGAIPDDSVSDTAAIKAAVSNLTGVGQVLYFPAGRYIVTNTIQMGQANVIIRGESPTNTLLYFSGILATGWHSHGFSIKSSAPFNAVTTQATNGLSKGTCLIPVSNAVGFASGDTVMLSDINISLVGQLAVLSGVNTNTHELMLDRPLRFDMNALSVQTINVLTNVGLEQIALELGNSNNQATVYIETCRNFWIRRVASTNTLNAHVYLKYCLDGDIRESYFNDAFAHGGDGQGYGINLQHLSGDCLIEDNIFLRLRHSINVERGVNGNVAAYNFSAERIYTGTQRAQPDLMTHGAYSGYTLFEGNVAERCAQNSSHSYEGHTITLRNHMRYDGIEVKVKPTDREPAVLGNVFTDGATLTVFDATGAIIHGNTINGITTWSNGLCPYLPPSLYLSNKPSFMGTNAWPAFGPENPSGQGTIPARQRYESGQYIPTD